MPQPGRDPLKANDRWHTSLFAPVPHAVKRGVLSPRRSLAVRLQPGNEIRGWSTGAISSTPQEAYHQEPLYAEL